MRSSSPLIICLVLFVFAGCGSDNGIPRPEDTPGWDPVTVYASSIKREVMAVVAVAESNPREATGQADAALESFNDTADTGEYAETINEIKEKLKAMAAGKGKATGLKELAAKLPGEVPTRNARK